MKKIRVAVIGLGKMGLLHSSILSSIPEVEITALCDKSYILRRMAKKLFKSATVVSEVEKMHELEIDCAFVATPISSHFKIISTLLSSNITNNVFVEKTLSSNWNNAEQLCSQCKRHQGTNMVGYMKRFNVIFSKARKILFQNVLGPPTTFTGFAYSSDFAGINQTQKTSSRGGVLSDLGSHIIDLALWFIGDFKVENSVLKSSFNNSTEDEATFTIKKTGLVGQFDISWIKDDYRLPNFGLTIQGPKGTMIVNDYNLKLELNTGKKFNWYRHDLNDNVNFLLAEPEYYREDEAFINSLIKGANLEPSFTTASKVDLIIDQVKKAAV